MVENAIAEVKSNGDEQTITVPKEFRFNTREVIFAREPGSGRILLSERVEKETPEEWRKQVSEIFAALDQCDWTEFDLERDMSPAPIREAF